MLEILPAKLYLCYLSSGLYIFLKKSEVSLISLYYPILSTKVFGISISGTLKPILRLPKKIWTNRRSI